MRLNLLGVLLGLVLTSFLVIGPYASTALATGTSSDNPHAGHDMSTMTQSDPHSSLNMDNMTPAQESVHETTEGHGSNSQHTDANSHSGENNTPPNWPVISGFGILNLLIITAAALMKKGAAKEMEVS